MKNLELLRERSQGYKCCNCKTKGHRVIAPSTTVNGHYYLTCYKCGSVTVAKETLKANGVDFIVNETPQKSSLATDMLMRDAMLAYDAIGMPVMNTFLTPEEADRFKLKEEIKNELRRELNAMFNELTNTMFVTDEYEEEIEEDKTEEEEYEENIEHMMETSISTKCKKCLTTEEKVCTLEGKFSYDGLAEIANNKSEEEVEVKEIVKDETRRDYIITYGDKFEVYEEINNKELHTILDMYCAEYNKVTAHVISSTMSVEAANK